MARGGGSPIQTAKVRCLLCRERFADVPRFALSKPKLWGTMAFMCSKCQAMCFCLSPGGKRHAREDKAKTVATATSRLALWLCVVLALGLFGNAEAQPGLRTDSPPSLNCGTVAKAHPVETLVIPHKVFEYAKRKARLSELLRESLYDDSKGIINIARDKEIRKLANEIRKESR